MLGAIIGDIVGSVYEFDNIKTKNFIKLLRHLCLKKTKMKLSIINTSQTEKKSLSVSPFAKFLLKWHS